MKSGLSYISFTTWIAAFLLTCAASGFAPAAANSKYAALVIHADTGDILFDKYSTQRRFPASLTKMMTLYLLFEEVESGRLSLDSSMKVSRYAASMPASDLGLQTGEKITVEQAIDALVIKSANDVAVVVAEKIGGSEKGFAKKMTNRAWAMGMRSTQFRNASGLPNRKQYTTARDLAVLSQRIMQDFPQYWSYFQKSSFVWKSKTYKSHNKLIGKFNGADGLKTGYTRMSGYNLATSVARGDNRLIGIVLGGRSTRTRDAHMKKIIDQAYSTIARKPFLISSVHRIKPRPNLKPTTLAEVGGSWPPIELQIASANLTDAPIIAGSAALPGQLSSQAAVFGQEADDNSVQPDDMTLLISENMTEAEKLNIIALAEAYATREYAEGDIDDTMPSADISWSIQTGAYSTRQLAETEQTDIQTLFADLITDSSPEISEIISDGKSVYRVRFNYMSEKQSEDACAAIIGNGGDCFSMRDPSISDG